MVRILINSPDEDVARVLQSGLEPQAYLVTDVRPGPAFVRTVREEWSDIVIIDRVHERPDAAQVEIEVVKGLRPEARIIVISGESSEKDAKIIEQGVYYYLTSGTVPELIRVIKAAAKSLGVQHKETQP
jgi:DNA-binding NtrC family response regulator